MLERIAGIMLPVLTMIGVGWLYARRHAPDMSAINRVNMDLFAPALIFTALAGRDFSIHDNRWLLAASALIVLGSGVLAFGVARAARVSARTFVPPMMFNNCGNMGLPIALLAFGQAGLGPAVAMFVVSNAIHFTLGARIVDPRASVRQLVLTPMNLATVAGFAVAATDLPRPEIVMSSLKLVGDAMIPLMLFALGVRMVSVNRSSWRIGLLGALACPLTGLAIAFAIDPLLPLDADQRGLMYIFASLPPAVLNFMVAERYNREPGKVAAIVLVGNVASVVFVPIGLAIGLR
ncbi:MAG TPA: AEC family transporter [Burkholderiaceae bacterium]|nr:AEC family transporter [Burkholderiaceae bacterium]